MTDINSLKRTIATYINDHRDIVPSFLQRILISMLDASQANEATLPIEEIVIDTENGDTIETAKTKVNTLTTLGFHVLVAPEEVVPFTTPSKAIILSMDESESSGVQIATNTQGDLLLRYCSNAEWSEWAPISGGGLSNGGTINGPLIVKDPGSTVPLTVNSYKFSPNQLISNILFSVESQSLGQLGVGQLEDNGSIVPCFTDGFGRSYQIALLKDISSGGGSTATDTTSIMMQSITSDTALNSFLGSGVQYGYASSAVADLPTDVLILSLGYSSSYGRQYAIDNESFRTWCRYNVRGTWSEWVEINAASEFSLNLTPIGSIRTFHSELRPVNANAPTAEYYKLPQAAPNTPDYVLVLFYSTYSKSDVPFFGYVNLNSLMSNPSTILTGEVPIYVVDSRLNGYNNILDVSENNVEVRACYGCYLNEAKDELVVLQYGSGIGYDVTPKYKSEISRRFISMVYDNNYSKYRYEYEQCFEINFPSEKDIESVVLPIADTTSIYILSATGSLHVSLDGTEEWIPYSFSGDGTGRLSITTGGSLVRVQKNVPLNNFNTCKAYITIRYIEYD